MTRLWHRLTLTWQLVIPFGLLALVWMSSGTYLLTRTAMTRAESRIDAELYEQLVRTGTAFTDLVTVEIELQRLASYTDGTATAVERGDARGLEARLAPLLVNSRADGILVLRPDGSELLSLWRNGVGVVPAHAGLASGAGARLAGDVNAGGKTIVLSDSAHGPLLLAGGAVGGDADAGLVVTALRVSTLLEHFSRGIDRVALYTPHGEALVSSPDLPALELSAVTSDELVRASVGDHDALVGSLSGRGQVVLRLAVFHDSTSILEEVRATALRLALLGLLSGLGVVAIGIGLSRVISGRLARVARSAEVIARGDLTTRAEVTGDDEVATLAASFNAMAEELERRAAELAGREQQFRSLVQHSSDVITIIDTTGRVIFQSSSVANVLGYSAADLVGTDFEQLVHEDDHAVLNAALSHVTLMPGAALRIEVRLRHHDGTWRQAETTITNMVDESSVAGLVLNTRDVTERTQLAEQLRHQAFHDPLTGLANRALFADRAQHAITRRRGTGTVAVLLVDLDDFKTVNDSYGHQFGDELLVAVAHRIRAGLRQGDTIARLGGDEFAILLEDLDEPVQASEAAERVLATLRAPFEIGGRELVVEASVGVARTEHGTTAQDALRCADLALYAAKNAGRSRYEVFQPSMQASAVERLELMADLRRAVDTEELTLVYQPVVELATARLTGMEALLRWEHPTRGPLPPDQFVPLAEETGVIHALGRWVVDEAARQLAGWQERYPAAGALHVNVNLSTRQLQDPDLEAELAGVVRTWGLEPGRITLEVTESALMHDTDLAIARLGALRALGFRIAVDDFGTGYSSLSYLERFPVDVLKIDKSFIVTDSEGEPRHSALLPSIVALGRSLGVETVAEGIEHESQVRDLVALGCTHGQGYYLSPPLARSDVDRLLEALTAEVAASSY